MPKPISDLKTAADFREFFAEIPEEKWITGAFERDGCCCAAGHLGARKVSDYLLGKVSTAWSIAEKISTETSESSLHVINDERCLRYPQPTPKARILAMLDDAIKKGL